jgi:biopolymer transport protein ExbB/TolQ
MVLDSGSFVKVILLLLLCFSVVAWAVIFNKYRSFGRVEKANSRFLRLFRNS